MYRMCCSVSYFSGYKVRLNILTASGNSGEKFSASSSIKLCTVITVCTAMLYSMQYEQHEHTVLGVSAKNLQYYDISSPFYSPTYEASFYSLNK